MSTIFEKITLKGKEAAQEITNSTKNEIKEMMDLAEEKALLEKEETIKKTKLKIDREITQKERSFTLDKRQAILKHKMSLLDEVINKQYQELNTLTKTDLLKFSLILLKDEKLSGKQTMQVNEVDYMRYLEAFSTNKKADFVILNTLNDKLDKGVEITLVKEPANIEDGFLIIGEHYDLNFSIKNYVSKLKDKYEKEIFKILFGE